MVAPRPSGAVGLRAVGLRGAVVCRQAFVADGKPLIMYTEVALT